MLLNLVVIGIMFILTIINMVERLYNRRFMNMKEKQIIDFNKILLNQNKVISDLSKDVDHSMHMSFDLLEVINKMGSNIKISMENIDKDMNNVINILKTLSLARKEGIRAHNELVNYTVEELSKIWCDLNEDDCSACPFEETCKKWEPLDTPDINSCLNNDEETDEDNESEDNKSFIVKDYDVRDHAGSMTIDPEDPQQLKALKDKMESTGLPSSVINQYTEALKDLLDRNPNHPKKIDIEWRSELIHPLFNPTKRFSNIVKNENKLIDPNSKIVKSLEKLFKES